VKVGEAGCGGTCCVDFVAKCCCAIAAKLTVLVVVLYIGVGVVVVVAVASVVLSLLWLLASPHLRLGASEEGEGEEEASENIEDRNCSVKTGSLEAAAEGTDSRRGNTGRDAGGTR